LFLRSSSAVRIEIYRLIVQKRLPFLVLKKWQAYDLRKLKLCKTAGRRLVTRPPEARQRGGWAPEPGNTQRDRLVYLRWRENLTQSELAPSAAPRPAPSAELRPGNTPLCNPLQSVPSVTTSTCRTGSWALMTVCLRVRFLSSYTSTVCTGSGICRPPLASSALTAGHISSGNTGT
jgi:hypothetical protein